MKKSAPAPNPGAKTEPPKDTKATVSQKDLNKPETKDKQETNPPKGQT
jgi:hypothetical protein